jgi:hypothetical protein
MNQLRLFTLKPRFLKISVDLQAALAAETPSTEGQWLEEQMNVEKLRTFRAGTRRENGRVTSGAIMNAY